MTTKDKLIELKSLSANAGKNIYQRCKLATEILSDQGWIVDACEGSELKAIDLLEDEYFADLRGFITVGRLRQLYQAFSEEREWQEFDYDLAAMEAQFRQLNPQENSGLRGERTKWKEIAERLKEEVKQIADERDRMSEKNRELERSIARLEVKIEELESELSRELETASAALGARDPEMQT